MVLQPPTQDELDNAGRIHKSSYVGSVAALFLLCWLTAAVRFYIRFGLQRIFALDDVFLILGLASMTAMFGMVISCLNDAYATTAVLAPNGLGLVLQSGFLEMAFNYKKMIDITLMLAWFSMVCVKLSYLFLFRKLIDRLRYMKMYWWFVITYVVTTSGYVLAVYYLVCPYYYSFKAIQCITGEGITQTVRYTVSQIAIDIVGDLLILVIPVHIIWKIKVHTKQKIGLATSLCLTIVIIAMAIIRVAGIMTPDHKLDQLWDGYWNLVGAQVGLIMASATAFRALYVSSSGSGERKETSNRITWLAQWWYKARSRRRTYEEGKELSDGSYWSSNSNGISTEAPQVPRSVLPRGHLGQNTLTSETGAYDSKLRMSGIIEAPWDETASYVDEDLQTKRNQIELASKNYKHSRNW